MQGRGHLLNGRKKSWENEVPESKASPPIQQYPNSGPRRQTFASETQSEADIIVSRPQQPNVARSLSTPDSSSPRYKSNRPTSNQFPQSNAASRPIRADGQGDSKIYDAQQMMPQDQGRLSYGGNVDDNEQAPTTRDNVSPSQPMSWESKYSKADSTTHWDSQRGQSRRDGEIGNERPLRPPVLSTERYEAPKAKWDVSSPARTNGDMEWWNFRDAQNAQASSSQQRPASQIVSPRTSGYSEEPQRLMDEGRRIRQPSTQQLYQDSDTKNRLYQAQNRGSTSSAYQPMPSQRWSTDSYTSEAGHNYQRDPKDDEYYGPRQMQRSQTDQLYPDSKPNEGRGQQPVLRRHTGFEDQDFSGQEERDPRRQYTRDEDRPLSDTARAFEWKVRVRWDDSDSAPSWTEEICTMKFDSGCEDSNWVSEDIALSIGAQIKRVEPGTRYVAVNGGSMEPIGQTSLAFVHIRGGRSFPRTNFLVASGKNFPFDMVLGATDSVRFRILEKPRDPSDPSMFWGLAAAPLTPAQRRAQEERDIAQAQTRKDQKDKQRWFRKKVGDQTQNTGCRNGEPSKRNTTTPRREI